MHSINIIFLKLLPHIHSYIFFPKTFNNLIHSHLKMYHLNNASLIDDLLYLHQSHREIRLFQNAECHDDELVIKRGDQKFGHIQITMACIIKFYPLCGWPVLVE